ncbi:phospholipase D-like domain-containing protein [Bacillaceae bacterium S4-13-56]
MFLHAKIYLFDEKTILVGSANFTNRGLGVNGEPNKEILIKRKVDKADANLIMDKFWNHEEEILFKDISDFQKKVEDISEKYPDIDVQIQNAQIDFKNTFLPKITPHQKLMILMKAKGLIRVC